MVQRPVNRVFSSLTVLTAIASFVLPVGLLAAPAQAQTLSPQFAPNPMELRGKGGGDVSVSALVGRTDTPTGECTGFANARPNHTIVLTSQFNGLSLKVQSGEDTALTIKGPGGVWCNDDLDGKNPGLSGQWLPGSYAIWISSYSKNSRPTYILRIQEQR